MSAIDLPIFPVPGMSGGRETLPPESKARLSKDKIKKVVACVSIYVTISTVGAGIGAITEYLVTKQVTAALPLITVGAVVGLTTVGMVAYFCKPQLRNSMLFRHCPSAC